MNADKGHSKKMLRGFGYLGIALSTPFFIWLALGWTGMVPSMIDVFGMEGLRTPASFVIGGLLIAALGFYEF